MNNNREELVKIIFATHPEFEKIYVTSDDQAFDVKHNAENHAQTLADKTVTPYHRTVVEKIAELKEKLGWKVEESGSKEETEGKEGGSSESETPIADALENSPEDEIKSGETSLAGAIANASQETIDALAGKLSAKADKGENEVLRSTYFELFGKKPVGKTIEFIKKAIEEKQAADNQNQ